MSWQAAVFAGLGLIVVAGFWWYERSRPSARLVALVAALAALAIAGRLVLAPIPNVVATTDIVLITGYALGAGPGFAVGALAAPISNIWLGQGPWTAWEMAGWGLVGLGGAWLAVLTRRRLGRLGLATVCALAGFAYGALLDLSVMVTYGGEQSLDRYLALSARGLPFNVAHAAGNFVIALAAGPALVRMISRFRTRLEFTWRPAGALPVVLVALVAVGVAGRPAATDAARSSAAWLVGTQNDDGGFSATPGQPSSPAMTGWAMLGLEAAGTNPLDLRRGGETPVSYLRAEAGRLRSVGDLERTILALEAAGVDSRRFAGNDLVERLRRRRDGDGSVDGQVNLTAFYALALRAAGADPASLARTGRWLRRAQNDDGGWGIQPLAPSEADSTGAALQGLVAVGERRPRDGARRLVAGQGPAPGRRLRARRQRRDQFAVDRLGHPGPRGDRGQLGRGRRGALLPQRIGAPPTATIATRPRRTRRRPGSPRRRCSRSSASRFRSRRSPAPRARTTPMRAARRRRAGRAIRRRTAPRAPVRARRRARPRARSRARRAAREAPAEPGATLAPPRTRARIRGRSARRRPRPRPPERPRPRARPTSRRAPTTPRPRSASPTRPATAAATRRRPTCWSAWARWRCWSRAPTPGTGAGPRGERGPPR